MEQLLAIEMERSDEPMSVHNERIKAHRMQLSDFMITIVYASGPLTKDEIRTATNLGGYSEIDGRKFHMTLSNITKSGKLMQLSDGRYVHPGSAAQLATLCAPDENEGDLTLM